MVARTFNAAAGRIEGLLKSQQALLANASHELRSPLARLRVAIEIWLARPGPEAQEEIVRDLGEIDALIEEILLASRLDHGGPTIAREERIDLLGLAAEEAARLGPGAGAAVTGEAAVEIDGDRKLLRRLIRNLLENAGKHGRPPIEVAVTRRGGSARLAVSDRGATIPSEERERVFEPFYRPAGRGESSGGWGARIVAGPPDRRAAWRRHFLRADGDGRQSLCGRSAGAVDLLAPQLANCPRIACNSLTRSGPDFG